MTNNLNYDFSFDEVKRIVTLFRGLEVPPELKKFYAKIENHIYENMTIQEAEEFLNEK